MKRPSPSMAVALTALFISLGGVSYGVATGTIDSREIRNNSVSSKDLRNNNVLGKDVRNGTLRGPDVNESSLGTVPRAATAATADTAGNAAALGGLGAGAFARAIPAATVDVPNGEATERTVLAMAGRGRLVIKAGSCDTSLPTRELEYAWRNTTGTDQEVWFTASDTDDANYLPTHGMLDPQNEAIFTFNGGDPHNMVTTLRIRPEGSPGVAVTLEIFASTSAVPGACRLSVQAVVSG